MVGTHIIKNSDIILYFSVGFELERKTVTEQTGSLSLEITPWIYTSQYHFETYTFFIKISSNH